MSDWLNPARPLSIAHRGASAYAAASSLQAFEFASLLGADMWEADLQLTRDEQLVVFHDPFLPGGQRISELNYSEIASVLPGGEAAKFAQVLDLAKACGAGIYADIKAFGAAAPACKMLESAGIERAILGAFDSEIVSHLGELGTPYPRAVLVPVGVDPLAAAGDAEIVHLCWESLDRPEDLLTQDFFERCRLAGKKVVLWHEEDPARMQILRKLPVLGICSDRPELVNPFVAPERWPVQIVCHRGANSIAPENSIPAAVACFAAGFSHAEIDVHSTSDGELVVIHDAWLSRTTNGDGLVKDHSLQKLRALSNGGWFSHHYSKEVIPTLDEILALAKAWGGSLYVELKSAPAEKVWNSVKAQAMAEKCFFWSFNAQLLRDLRALSKEARIMIRRQDFPSLEDALNCLEPALIEFTHKEDLSEIAALQEKNIEAMVAYNGRDHDIFHLIASHMPDLVNLHHPFEFTKSIFGNGR